jgi:histidine ammonia-lyase
MSRDDSEAAEISDVIEISDAVETGDVVEIDGSSLTCSDVTAVARREAQLRVSPAAEAAARDAWQVARELTTARPVYGRNTGVGANHVVALDAQDRSEHGLRLLRSHAAGAGPLRAREVARAMLVVRANQIGAGGSGVDPAILAVLADAINRGFTPPVPRYGAIGTGDLTALASAGLCLLGERAWQPGTGPPPLFPVRSAEALAFISSNAATLGEAALACCDLAGLIRAAVVVAGLSLLAVRGSAEPYAAPVHLARPHPGQQAVAARMRSLLAGEHVAAARIQDPYGYRAFPQVHGPALDALEYTESVIARELNAASENPLVDVAGHTVWHNGNFHAAYIGLALDALRAAVFQTAALSAARLGTLVEPSFTGLEPFQAETPASSGIMVLEYVAQSAVADIRRFAAPAALGSAVLSRGVEEHAGFATQSARATREVVPAYRAALACELVAAVRALRMQGRAPAAGGRLRPAYSLADAVLDPRTADRPLDADLTAAGDLLGEISRLPAGSRDARGDGAGRRARSGQ